MKCALCENEQSRASFAPIPSKKVATIILLSCLARYNVITLEDAKKHYKDVFVSRKRVCKNHFIQAIMFLGWEIEQLSGEFPLNGISEAPAIVMDSLLIHLRKYRGLLDDTMPMEKKDVREFFNEYMVEFHDEITERISTPNSAEEALFLKANANFDIKKEEESTSQIVINEQLPGTSDGRDTDSPAFFVPKEELESPGQNVLNPTSFSPNLPHSSASSSDEGDNYHEYEARMTCVICSVTYPVTQLKVASRLPQRNIIFLTCMLIKRMIKAEDAVRIYNEFKRTPKRCCKKHYFEAAKLIQEELKKCPECLPNEARVPRFIPMELLQLLKENGDFIDKDVVLNAGDVAAFFRECLNKFHNGKEWELVEGMEGFGQHGAPKNRAEHRLPTRKRRHEGEEEPGVQPKASAVGKICGHTRISTTPRNSNYKDQCSCVVCCCTRDKSEFYRTSPHTDQNIILLSCLVLNGSFKTEVAKVMLREIIKDVQLVCKKHYMLSMLYIYKSIKEKWNQLATSSFCALPVYIRVDLVDRINQCASQIQKGLVLPRNYKKPVEITEDLVEQFYNTYELKFNVISRLIARDTGRNEGDTPKDKVYDVLKDDSFSATQSDYANRTVQPTVKSRYCKKTVADGIATNEVQFSNSAGSFAPIPTCPRWQIQRKRQETSKRMSLLACGLCGCVRLLVDVRKESAKAGRTNVLLACLMRQGLVHPTVAAKFHKDASRAQKRLCNEHFIHAGAYLAAAVRTLTGQYPSLGLWNIPFDIMANIVAILQEHLHLITHKDALHAYDVASFFNDYLMKYVETDEWKITEVLHNGIELGTILDLDGLQRRRLTLENSEKMDVDGADEELFSNNTGGQSEEDQLFCKTEKDEQSDIIIIEEQRSASEPPQNISKHGDKPDSAALTPVQSLQQEIVESWKTRCGVCYQRAITGLRKPSTIRNYNIVLLACMVMDNTIDVSEATDLMWKISYFNVVICDKHFIAAVRFCLFLNFYIHLW
ncbi:hypothetical protein Y032_0039g16 [Ancylostoma ceylanicum]|uniref:Uncharacterized protein n=1 Tax=Ancylostoma ceylanicum TaxID=53326 RepID=A0A016UIW8_9BILA|nr:hypothetical protein Y032_0039g16 [Ancylostoma ceylanicum]